MVLSSCSFVGKTGKKGDAESGKLKFSAFEMEVFDKSELRADLNKRIDSGVGMFLGNQFTTCCSNLSAGKSIFAQMSRRMVFLALTGRCVEN